MSAAKQHKLLYTIGLVSIYLIYLVYFLVYFCARMGALSPGDTALQILKEYAHKGELYSKELREHILSVMKVKERVCIRALTTSARAVFGQDKLTVAGFVREMVHDRLLMKSEMGIERVPDENDVYYDAVYLRRNYPVSNNILWEPGVPIRGILLRKVLPGASINGLGIIRGEADEPKSDYEGIVFCWGFTKVDSDRPSALIENSKCTEAQVKPRANPKLSPRYRRIKEEVLVGRYCHPPPSNIDTDF